MHIHAIKISKKEPINMKESKGIWEGLEGGYEKKKCCNYINLTKTKKKSSIFPAWENNHSLFTMGNGNCNFFTRQILTYTDNILQLFFYHAWRINFANSLFHILRNKICYNFLKYGDYIVLFLGSILLGYLVLLFSYIAWFHFLIFSVASHSMRISWEVST